MQKNTLSWNFFAICESHERYLKLKFDFKTFGCFLYYLTINLKYIQSLYNLQSFNNNKNVTTSTKLNN